MEIEYEATFTNIDKDNIRERLKKCSGILKNPEFLQRRFTFNFPEGHDLQGGWLRVRDERDKITMSIKQMDGDGIADQKELCIAVDDFDSSVAFLKRIGCEEKAYQENRRERWILDDVEVTIDEWPFLEPFVEVEGNSEKEVRAVSEKLAFDWGDAKFCAIGQLYAEKYNILESIFNNATQRIVFDMENPFIEK